jgi:hypothetical protein
MKKFQEMFIRQEAALQAVQRSAESSKDKTKPEINHHQAPQNKPDMMAYREGGDTLMMDGESDTSDEQALMKGKMWDETDEDFDGGGGSRLKSADVARGNTSNESDIAVEPRSPSPNHAHNIDIGVDSEDDVVEIVVPPNAIPAPYKFSRPRGGDGPRLKISKVAPNRSHIAAEPQSPPQNHPHLPLSAAASAPQTAEMVALVTRTVFDLLDKRNIGPDRKTKPAVSTKVKAPAVNTCRPRRTILAVSLQKYGKEPLLILYRGKSV